MPFTPKEALEGLGPQLPLFTSLSFIGGIVVGLAMGFKLA